MGRSSGGRTRGSDNVRIESLGVQRSPSGWDFAQGDCNHFGQPLGEVEKELRELRGLPQGDEQVISGIFRMSFDQQQRRMMKRSQPGPVPVSEEQRTEAVGRDMT